MANSSDILLSTFHYELPPERIASHPLSRRDQSKLLVYRGGEIRHRHFFDISKELPEGSLLVLNDTKVIPARLILHRATGARIEILLLKPIAPKEVNKAMIAKGHCSWSCMIGNKKKWKDDEILSMTLQLEGISVHLHVSLIDREKQWVQLSWDQPEVTFAEIVNAIGKLPLPPYLNREASQRDREQYQTVYAEQQGAVAAPTAGLHFTDSVLKDLETRGIDKEFVTLHVSAGTFQPVKHEVATEHPMHAEQLIITEANVDKLLSKLPHVIAVGTTSMRVLESLYWFGVQILNNQHPMRSGQRFRLDQHYAYQFEGKELPEAAIALQAVKSFLATEKRDHLVGETEIYIYPGYDFKIVKGLITNFHLPETTLMLLVAAFIGDDWRKVYEAALAGDYRFLSYGDSSLLWR
jgi:S-adenosylmethionine:tRNA ribosyltransferase-isomerase